MEDKSQNQQQQMQQLEDEQQIQEQHQQQQQQHEEQQIQEQQQQQLEQDVQSVDMNALSAENISNDFVAATGDEPTEMCIQEEEDGERGNFEIVGTPVQPAAEAKGEAQVEIGVAEAEGEEKEEEEVDYQQYQYQHHQHQQQQQQHHRHHNNYNHNQAHRQYNPKKSVSFKTLVDIFQLSDAWQLHVKKSSLKTEEDQAKRRILQRNY